MKKMIIGLLMLIGTFSMHAAERLVVAGGSLSEVIFAMGAGNRVVGVDETTTFPPETGRLPHIGNWMQLSSEGILSLAPDSFITWQDAKPPYVLDQLRAQKVQVITLPRVPSTPEQMYNNIHVLAVSLHIAEQGDALVNSIRQRLDNVRESVMGKAMPVNAIFILSTGGGVAQVAGKETVADAIMTLAGAHNLAKHTQYKGYNAEALVVADPEVIIVTSQMVEGGMDRLSAITGITHTAAWKNQRIVVIDQALILGMGPRIAEAVETLHRQFWPLR